MEKLPELVLEVYARFIGLELADVAVDGCINKDPCGSEKADRSPVDRGKQGTKHSTAVDGRAIPLLPSRPQPSGTEMSDYFWGL